MPAVIVDGDADALEGEDDGELGERHDSPLDKGWEMVRGVMQDQRACHGHGNVQTHMKIENPDLAIVFEYWRTNAPMHLFSEWVQVLNETGKKRLGKSWWDVTLGELIRFIGYLHQMRTCPRHGGATRTGM